MNSIDIMYEDLSELKVCLVDQTTNVNSENKISESANKLLEIVKNNKSQEEIQHIIDRSTIELINHKYIEYDNKNILIIACLNKHISKDTLNHLYFVIKSRYSYVDCTDENWYKWDPLHHVARIADPEKLQVLVNNMDNVNTLTTYSENALHVLLEYEESVNPFNTLLYNGTESRDCTVINTEKSNMVQCAKILIDVGIDVNHSNFWNETPLCLAVRYRYTDIIKLLLRTPYIDLDNYKEGGKTIRAYLKQNYIYQGALPQSNFLHEEPVKLLFNFLKSGDEEAFLHFNNENIKDYANCIDGDSEYNSAGNMLQFCFKKRVFRISAT
ncbi:hypothetical protein NQ314_020143 [Rhamnusium bicolor]|uniref:Ankyrin repeat protein n=1 Tax=Rhamnusium bicolor TaxID=1586634 RepID=A0AAV8WLG7_9CUCU|nr:hypothetical protein NQ314_020143 [Rhamnusium bicolor]